MVAMCACNTPNFPPMMCNVSVMVVRIWKLHSMHIFVPHLITLRGTNWIRGQHPAIITQGLDTWRSAHSCMSYRGAIPGYYCRVFSKNVNNIQSWHLWLGIMAPRIIAARLEKSEKRNLKYSSGSLPWQWKSIVYFICPCLRSVCVWKFVFWCTILPTE